jgi:ubiquinone/menaquinone biosynthesis C-methylase UbiE
MPTAYTQGHSSAVLSSHQWRTVVNSASYLIPYLKSDSIILDVGCGPGTLSIDLATRVPAGRVYGIDLGAEAIGAARKLAETRGVTNVTFIDGDLFDLPEPVSSMSFNIVHAHQTLLHIPDKLGAIRIMKILLREGGHLAIRDADVPSFIAQPRDRLLDKYHSIIAMNMRAAGCTSTSGRHLLSLVLAAGTPREAVNLTVGHWCYTTDEEKKWWGDTCAERIRGTEMRTRAIENGVATEEECEAIAQAWEQ